VAVAVAGEELSLVQRRGYCKIGGWSGFGGYLVAEGGSEFGTETGLLQNGEVEWNWCVFSG
jgi:hypothetical protein